MTHQSKFDQRVLSAVSQGDKLNTCAAARTGDLNESHLLVHGVMARAMAADASSDLDLDLALSHSLDQWRGALDIAA